MAFVITNDLLIKHCYLDSACPPGQYIAQYGSGKGHNSGFSVQNRQVGVKSLKEISGVKLWPLTISVLSIIKFFISSSDLTLLTYRRIKQQIPLWNAFEVSWPRNRWIIPLYMSLMLKLIKYPPIIYFSTCLSRMRRRAWHVWDITSLSWSRQLERYLKNTTSKILLSKKNILKFLY